MKTSSMKRIAAVVAVLSLTLLSGCGSDSNSAAIPSVATNPYGLNGITGSNGEASIQAPISFAVQGAYIDSANIVAGQVPYAGGGNVGYVQVGNATSTVGCSPGMPGCISGTSQDTYGNPTAQVTMSATSMSALGSGYAPYSGYPQNAYYTSGLSNPNSAYIQGTIYLYQQEYTTILSQMSGYYGGTPYSLGMASGPFSYNGSFSPSGTPYVSNVAMNIGHYGYQLYGGYIFLYMNNTLNGYVLQFYN